MGLIPDVDDAITVSGGGVLIDLGKDAPLDIKVFGSTLLHVVRLCDSFGDRVDDGHGALVGGWQFKVTPRGAGVGKYLVDDPLSVGVGISHQHVNPMQSEPSGPSGTDHTGANNGNCLQ